MRQDPAWLSRRCASAAVTTPSQSARMPARAGQSLLSLRAMTSAATARLRWTRAALSSSGISRAGTPMACATPVVPRPCQADSASASRSGRGRLITALRAIPGGPSGRSAGTAAPGCRLRHRIRASDRSQARKDPELSRKGVSTVAAAIISCKTAAASLTSPSMSQQY